MSKIKSFVASCATLLATIIGVASPSVVQADTPAPGWTAVKLDSSETNIRTDGTLKYAYTASTTELTANGVTFSPWVSSSWNNNTSLENDNVILSGVFMRNTSANSEGVTGDYGAILNNAFWNNTLGDYTITFNNLTSGKRYLAQIVVHLHNGRPQLTVKDSDPSVWVKPYGFEAGQTWTYGGSLICVFDATGSSQSFTLNYSVDTPCSFNAIQVRELSGGDDPDPTVVDPEIGSIAATVNGMSVTIDLSGIVLGTDAQGASATYYKVDYEVRNSGGTAIKSGTVLSGQTAETASFDIANFTDPGTYTCEVTITTDKNRTASKSVEFTLTGEDPPTPGPTEGWTAEPMSASGDTIRKDGDFVYGYARKGGNGTYTVNGVTFTAFNDGGDFKQESKNPNVSISPNTFDWTTGLGSESISGDYGSMLDNAFWSATVSGNYTITLKNLEAGKSYLVQVVAHRSGQTYSVTSPDPAKAITVGGTGWTYGGSLVGVFAAETTEYSFTLNYGGSFVLNAIQVRKITGVTPPTPATYAVIWTGGENATVDAKANGSAISSGAKVGDGTNVVFTVTPNTDYEFAEASYQDWTKSGDALTRTVTVNGAAVSITIPNATEKTTPPPGPTEGWTAVKMTLDPKSIRTDGELVYAYARGNYTANGVVFKEATANESSKSIANDDLTWVFTGANFFPGKNYNFDGIDDVGYKNLMTHSWGCQNTDPHTIELKGLTQGSTYLVQIVGCQYGGDNDGKVWVQETSDQTFGTDTPYIYVGNTHDGDDWTYGGSLIGVFTAESSTKLITLKYASGSWAGFNAIQVRKLSDVPPGPTVVKPSIESVTATVNATANSAQITLAGIVMGTDDSGDPATSYSVSYVLDDGAAVEALTGQSAASVGFNLTGLTKGDHSLIVRVTTDKGKTAAKTIGFRVNNAEVEYGWTAAKMTAEPTSVRTDGVLTYAYAWRDCVVNGVEFSGVGDQATSLNNENLSWNLGGTLPKAMGDQGVADPGYQTLLKQTASCNGNSYIFTLKNLIPGHDYLVQVIGCNNNSTGGGDNGAKIYAGDEWILTGGMEWYYGGSLTGVVNAPSDTLEITFTKNGWSGFNAIQVRDLSLMDEDAVAIIERGATTNYFFTIGDAYNGATEGETIKLVKDADFPANDPVFSKSVDIDLNGFSLTRSNLAHVKEITSDTAITNGVIAFDSGVYPADTATPFLVGSGATLTLDTMNVGDANGHEPLCLMSVEGGSHVVLSGEGTYHVGSLFKSVDDQNTMTITGGRYILRGWFMPANRVYLFADYKKGKVLISGGSFSIAPENSWIADGYRILHDINDHETPYHVVPAAEAPYTESGWSYYYKDAAAAEAAHVAKRETAGGVKYYTSLKDAVSAANGSGTVTLVADIPSLDRGVTLGGTVTLDGAGHKVSVAHPYVNDSGFVANDFSFNIINMISVYPKEADVTLRNISLTGGGLLDGELANDGLAVVDNAGTLLMENVTVTRSNGAVYNEQTGVLYMDNCRLVRNCRFCAGGLFNVTGGFAVMNRSSLSENRSLGMAGGGGACENGGTLFVNNCVIVNNSSTEVGGAINNYASNHQPKLYMMNTTVSGNFSSIKDDTNAFEHDKGGAIGMRGETGAEFCAVNCLFSCNYQIDTRTDVAWGPITVSDMCSIDGGTAVKLYYSVYTGLKSMTPANTSTTEVREINEYETSTNVFNAYFASPRVYQNAKPTAMAINGAQLVSKDDGSLDATLARYAPIKRTDNGDGTYDYGQAVYGTDGVYTYFDPSDWKNKSVAMSYAPVVGTADFFNYEAVGEMQTVDGLQNAGEEYMVTNYYESASGRSFGVAGASGWLKGDVTYYTVKLVAEPENGTVSGATINGETYEEGTVIQLTATPGYARDFLGWYEITAGGATTNLIEGSNKTVWELTVDHNYELLAKFSDLQEVLTPDPYVHVKMADDTEGPLLYPITMMTKWMRDHYENFEDTLAGKTKAEAEEWLTQILEQTSPGTGRKMWQDYVLGVDPNDADAKIWINSPQIRQEGQTAIRMEMNRLSPASGTKFTINYRLDKKLGEATTFARSDVNGTGSYDVKIENDPSGLYVIDLLFIPEGYSTSEEYVTTVNTAGVLKVDNHAQRAAIAAPWTKLRPSGASDVEAVDLVKTTNLSVGDVLYLYDITNSSYRAWQMLEKGTWEPLDVINLGENGVVVWNPAETNKNESTSQIARGFGLWLERADTNGCIYVCGQYNPAGVDTTELKSGWNLVGNPLPVEYDLTKLLNENTAKGVRLVVPTAGTPKEYEYREGKGWGYTVYRTVKTPFGDSVKAEFVTDDFRVPAGCAFWYFVPSGVESPTLNWNGSKEDAE